jgi:hypothetical protein
VAGPIAECTHCGHLFEFKSLIGGSGTIETVVISNSVTNCPKCGHRAKFVDGTYRYENQVLTFLDGPASSRETIAQFYGILRRAEAGDISIDDAIAEAGQLGPDFGTFLRRVLGSTELGNVVAIIALLVAIFGAHLNAPGVDEEELRTKILIDLQNNPAIAERLASRPAMGADVRSQPGRQHDKANPKKSSRKSEAKERLRQFGRSRSR